MGQNNSKGKERSQDNSDTLVVPNLKVSNSYSEQNLSQLPLTSTSKSVLNFDHYPTNFISIKSRVTLKSNDNLKDEEENIIKNRNIFNCFKWSRRRSKKKPKNVNNECKDNSEKCRCKYLIIINETDRISNESTKPVGNSLTVSNFSRNNLLMKKLTTKTLLLNKSLIMFNTEMSRQICNLSARPKCGSKLCLQKNCKSCNFFKRSFMRKNSKIPSIGNLKAAQFKILPAIGKAAPSNRKSDVGLSINERKTCRLPNISSVLRRKINNKLSLSDTFCYNVSPSIFRNDLTIKLENRAGDHNIMSDVVLPNFNDNKNCALLNESINFNRKPSWCDRYTNTALTTLDKYSQCSSQDPALDIFLFPNLVNIASKIDMLSPYEDSKIMHKHLKKLKFEPLEKKIKTEKHKNRIREVNSKNYVYIPTEKYSFRSKNLLQWSKAQNVKMDTQEDKNPILERILQLNGGDNNSIVELKLDQAMLYTSSENVNLFNFAEKNDSTDLRSKEFSEIISEGCALLNGINSAIKKIKRK